MYRWIVLFVCIVCMLASLRCRRPTIREGFLNADDKIASASLEEHGYAIVPSFLDEKTTDTLRDLIFDTMENEELTLGDIDTTNDRRYDVLLPVTADTRKVMRTVYKRLRGLFDAYDTNPWLAEHSCFLNFPYSDPQRWHRDIEEPIGRMITVGVALEDITEEMGPLEVLPGSHKNPRDMRQRTCIEEMKDLCGYFNDVAKDRVPCLCSRGSLIIWDNTLVHRSAANKSDRLRSIFYFTLLCGSDKIPKGSTQSILPEFKNIRISDIMGKT
jgi:hypothetical protein